jgi:O-antigen/teichoic acid export membrane protein
MTDSVKKPVILKAYIAQFLNIASGILILPIIYFIFDETVISFWFSIVTFAGFIQMLEMGLLPTGARHISYIYHNESIKAGFGSNITVNSYIERIKFFYLFIALGGLLLLSILFYVFVYYVYAGNFYLYITGILFLLSYLINIYFNWLNAFYIGISKQEVNYNFALIQRICFIFFGVLILLLTKNILFYSLSLILIVLITRYYQYKKYRNEHYKSEVLRATASDINETKLVSKTIISQSLDIGIVGLATFLVQKFSILIAAAFLSKTEHAQYSLTITIIYVAFGLSSTYTNLHIHSLCEAFYKNKESFRIMLKPLYLSANTLFLILLLPIFIINFFSIEVFTSKLLSFNLFFFLSFVLILELNHSISSTIITTMNEIPFRNSAIISSISIVCLQFLTIEFFGVYGLIFSIFIVNLIYNNWRWPLYVYQKTT